MAVISKVNVMNKILNTLYFILNAAIALTAEDTIPSNVLDQVGLTNIRYTNLNWSFARDFNFKVPSKQSETMFIYIIPEITYDCKDDFKPGLVKLGYAYFEIRFHILLWDDESNLVRDHIIDHWNYENDAVRIKSFRIKNGVLLKPDVESMEIEISYGHNLQYNPYYSTRKIFLELEKHKINEILDIGTYSISGETTDTCEYYMRYNTKLLHIDESSLVNGYYPINISEISRKTNGELRCGYIERFNDTSNYSFYYKNGVYSK